MKLLTKVRLLYVGLLAVAQLYAGLAVAQSGEKFTVSGTVSGDGQPLIGATVV